MTQPGNPTVSGPGQYSQRTDRQPQAQLPDAAYGEQQTFREDQQGAPMAKAAPPGQAGPPTSPVDLSGVVPMGAPTQRPGEPVTAGAAMGAGPGVEALGINDDDDPAWQDLRDNLPALELMANQPSAGRALRQFVRRIRAMS